MYSQMDASLTPLSQEHPVHPSTMLYSTPLNEHFLFKKDLSAGNNYSTSNIVSDTALSPRIPRNFEALRNAPRAGAALDTECHNRQSTRIE